MFKQTAIYDIDYDNGISISFRGTKIGRSPADEYEKGLWAISLCVFADNWRGESYLLNEFPIFIKEMFHASFLEVQEETDKLFDYFSKNQPCWFFDVIDGTIHYFELINKEE